MFVNPHEAVSSTRFLMKEYDIKVNESVLKKVIEWCTHHKNDPPTSGDDDDSRRRTTDIDEWDQKFMQVDQEMLFEIILVRPTLRLFLRPSLLFSQIIYRCKIDLGI
jgi:hypothetical protein